MKIKRFQARNMREAIRLVREEQGPDAVILSNRRTPNGVEVVAAVDYDAALIQQTVRREETAPASAEVPATSEQPEAAVAAAKPVAPPPVRHEPRKPVERRMPPVPTPAEQVAAKAADDAAAKAASSAAEMLALQREMNTMRRMLEEQLAGLMWGDMQARRPRQAAALRALADLGIEPDIARQIAEEIPEGSDAERARFLPLGLLARRLQSEVCDPVLEGGRIALVGPTGVGKTTTIAKLAAHYSARFGVRDVALVTMDHYRIGAPEQLFTYGRLLGAPVHAVGAGDDLKATLDKLSDRKLVLIDTAGMSQRDKALGVQLEKLRSLGPQLKTFVVLAANTQPAGLEEVVRRFGEIDIAGCVLTKLDEASRVGGALSVAIRRKLPIAYFADGQRVPEDLHVAKADRLVLRATQLVRQAPAPIDDELLAKGFSELVTAHA